MLNNNIIGNHKKNNHNNANFHIFIVELLFIFYLMLYSVFFSNI